ncbi:MAG: glycosyltransferase family 4 protein [Deltaproteobacteria bacterium]|nr:glycosyltransferase family 4 protein [Deltaproteobacteria bacterium]
MSKNIGFVSTRFAGTDGVSLESSKWAEVFAQSGHRCFWFAGELDREKEKSLLVPQAHFENEQNVWINERVLGEKKRKPSVTESIHNLRSDLKSKLEKFIRQFNIELLVVENALSIPMNIPLGIALAEFISETQIPTIAHHHDFCWERTRYSVNAVGEYIHMAFPPDLPNIEHVVINSAAQKELAHRRGISSTIIPNVLDFENPPLIDVKHTEEFRKKINLKNDQIMILQPTRIIRRKGIELAIELARALGTKRCKLVISHKSGDEGFEYFEWIKDYAAGHGVDLSMADSHIASPWKNSGELQKKFSLWNVYPHADFVTFPSLTEGFGNAFLEAVYFKKPILINRYDNYVRDIEPKGFDLVAIDGFLNHKTVQSVKEVLKSPLRRKKMVEKNYEIATAHYSYSVLRKHLNAMIYNIFGESAPRICFEPKCRQQETGLDQEKYPAQIAV